MTKNKTQKNYLYPFILELQQMNNTEINFEYLRRKLRPYFRTTKTAEIYTITLKGTNFHVLIIPTDYDKKTKIRQFSVVSSKHQSKYLFTVYARYNRELLEKLVHKFNFFS